MYVLSFLAVPTVSFAVEIQRFTVNSADFAFSSAGIGMAVGGVRHGFLLVRAFFRCHDAISRRQG
jgi:hypothetical protein